jgi:hypothetical protein
MIDQPLPPENPAADAESAAVSTPPVLSPSETPELQAAAAKPNSGGRFEGIYAWTFGALLFLPMILTLTSGYHTPQTRTMMAEMERKYVLTSSPAKIAGELVDAPRLTMHPALLERVEQELEALQAAQKKLQQSIVALEAQAPPLSCCFELALEAASHNRWLEAPSNGEPIGQRIMHRVDWHPIMQLARNRFPESEREVQAFEAAQRRLSSPPKQNGSISGGRQEFRRRMKMERLSFAILDWLSGEKGAAVKWYSDVASDDRSVIAVLDDEQATEERGWSAGEVHVLKAIRADHSQSTPLKTDAKAQ